jgi:predicted transcriptional regulator
MDKKSLAVEIPEKLKAAVDALATSTARKKTILVAASLHHFLTASSEQQEDMISKYLNAYVD